MGLIANCAHHNSPLLFTKVLPNICSLVKILFNLDIIFPKAYQIAQHEQSDEI